MRAMERVRGREGIKRYELQKGQELERESSKNGKGESEKLYQTETGESAK